MIAGVVLVLSAAMFAWLARDMAAQRGPWHAGLFFACAVVFSFLKERHSIAEPVPEYIYAAHLPTIAGVPLLPVLGWVLTWGVAWAWADAHVLDFEKRTYRVVLRAALVCASVSFAVESCLVAIGLWRWRGDLDCLVIPPVFWFVVSSVFLGFYLVIVYGTRASRFVAAGCVALVAAQEAATVLDFAPFNRHETWTYLLAVAVLLFATKIRYQPSRASRDETFAEVESGSD
ncbi:MAG: hypothetical protein IT350_08485 [Deltaproteobacteria bacterium]|nr:hypothetical protein [Deltaproteobacteria bacterium]